MTTQTQQTLLTTSLVAGQPATAPAPAAETPAAPAPAPQPAPVSARDIENVERSLIDSASRGPVLTFFTTGVFWLLVSCLLGYIASKKLHAPDFILGPEWLYKLLGVHGMMSWIFEHLTYGRVWPAYNVALVYGWCSLAGMGVATWLIGRLTRVAIKSPGVITWGAWFWNFGVAAGVVTLLTGTYNSGLEYFELHPAAKACMLIGFLLIGVWGLILFRYKRTAVPYISVSYLVAAFFLFPWFFGATTFLSASPAITGVTKNIVNAWYQGGLFNLWFGCIGLAAAYYFIPKVINKPIYSYSLAKIGFWSWIFISGLTAMTRLSGGPVPAYLVTISVAASILLIIPVATVITNLGRTIRSDVGMTAWSPTIRFVYVGTVFFGISVGIAILASLRSVNAWTNFTQFNYGQVHSMLIGFFSLVMFGAIYYITPRLVGCEWLSRTFIKLHFLGTAYGGATIIALLLVGGVFTGFTMNEPTVADKASNLADYSFFNVPTIAGAFQAVKTYIGYTLFGLAQFIFAIHFLFMRLRIGQPAGEPTLLMNPEDAH